MKWTQVFVFALSGAVILVPVQVEAQGKGSAEIGFDLGLNIQIIDDIDESVFSINLPNQEIGALSFLSLQSVRVGFFVSESVQLEPTLGFSLAESDGETFWQLGLGLDAVKNFGAKDAHSRPFLGAGGRVRSIDFDGNSISQMGLSAGGGVKLRAGERTAIRLEASGSRWFENDDFLGHWDLGACVGFAVFTK